MDVVQTGGTPNDDTKDTPKGSVIDDVWPDFPYNSPPFAILGRVFGRDNLTPTVITWGFVSQKKIMV